MIINIITSKLAEELKISKSTEIIIDCSKSMFQSFEDNNDEFINIILNKEIKLVFED